MGRLVLSFQTGSGMRHLAVAHQSMKLQRGFLRKMLESVMESECDLMSLSSRAVSIHDLQQESSIE